MHVAVPIQQGTHIIDLFNILLLGYYRVSHIRITWLYQHLLLPSTFLNSTKVAFKEGDKEITTKRLY